jgi:uncharacterized protein (TIGR03437 family)
VTRLRIGYNFGTTKMRPRAWILGLALVLAQANAWSATLRNHLFALNSPPQESGCAAPLPVDYFESTDTNLVFWVLLQMKAGDGATISWTTTAHVLDKTNNIQAVQSDGEYCYWVSVPLAANTASATGGTWKFNVKVGSSSLFSGSVLVVAPGTTAISRGGVVNSASGTTNGGLIAAGSLVSIYGTKLAPGTAKASVVPLPTTLDGVKVTFNGASVGILAVSAGRVDVQAPWSIPSDTAFVQINNNGTLTNTERVRVGSAAPGLFYDSSNSANPATVYRYPKNGGAGSWVSAKNPLQRGDKAVFLATGLGAVTNPPRNFAPGKSASSAVLPVSVAFGGAGAAKASAAQSTSATPSQIGVTDVSVTVPNEVPNGTAVPVTLRAGGALANVVTVPIAGSVPKLLTPVLHSISGYPAVSSSAVYNPTAAISLTASSVYTNVLTYIRFADQSGYSATLPAMAVYSDRVISLVPPYLNPQNHTTTEGTVNCSIIQYVAGNILTSNALSIQIAPLYAAPGGTGQMTAKYLATVAQDAREVAGAYIYRQEITGGTRFKAVSAQMLADQIVTGLQPLVGGAEEVAGGNASSIDLGTLNGEPVSIDSSTLGLFDALISASLAETAKAYVTPPVVLGASSQTHARMGTDSSPDEAGHSILGSLGTYFGLVAQCNMSWDKLNDSAPNCPSPAEAVGTVLKAAGDSLVEAVDSVAEDAKRFAEGPGLLVGLLSGADGAVILGKLATDAAIAKGSFHFLRGLNESGEEQAADYKSAAKTLAELAADGFMDLEQEFVGLGLGALDKKFGSIGSEDEKMQEGYAKFAESGFGKIVEQLEKNMFDAPETLTASEDVTDSKGNNSLDQDIDSAPAVEITGTATNSSGTGLQNAGVELTDGNGADTPFASGATFADGTYDLLIPDTAVGNVVPGNALFQITALDEDQDIVAFDGSNVDVASGSQSIGTSSISYDPDDDDDDDSDGSLAILKHGHVGAGMDHVVPGRTPHVKLFDLFEPANVGGKYTPETREFTDPPPYPEN